MRQTITLSSSHHGLDDLIAALDGRSRVAVLAQDLIAPQAALAPITEDPFSGTTALVALDRAGDLVVRHHRVVSAATSFHEVRDATHRSVGALVIAPTDAQAARDAINDLRSALIAGDLSLMPAEMLEAVMVALVRGQVPVRAVEIVDVPWFRAPDDVDAATSAVEAESQQRILGLLANRVDDGFYSTFVVRKASKPITRLALRWGLSPNTITVISFVVGIAAAVAFATGSWPWIVVGALLLQVSLVIDCVDGEVARATRKFSSLGAWLDASTDRVKEFAAYAGLAFGASRMDLTVFGLDVWWIAIAMMVLQTVRHVSDYDFARIQRLREASVPAVDVRQPGDGRDLMGGGLAVAMDASARMNRRSAIRWLKKVIHMPIGERWLVLSVLAVLAGPAWALGGLLIAGIVAFGYVAVGRVTRTLTWSGVTPPEGPSVLRAQLDAGPLASVVGRVIPNTRPTLTGRFGWGVPVLLRAFELVAIAVLLLVVGVTSNLIVTFWIIFAIAYHHYDVLYRSLQGASPPRWLTWWGFGWDGRVLAVAIVALTAVWEPSLAILLAWWVLWFAGVASVQWLRSSR